MNLAALYNKIDSVAKTLKALETRLGQIEHLLNPSNEVTKGNSPQSGSSKEIEESPKTLSASAQRGTRKPLAAIGKILGWLSLALAAVTGYIQLRYDVSVVPYSPLNPSNPFTRAFHATSLINLGA